jgi:kynurenine formamidase
VRQNQELISMTVDASQDLLTTQAELDAIIERVDNWGRWGADDQLGTLNYITPEVRKAAAACVRTGKVFSLAVPFGRSGPAPLDGPRLNAQLTMLQSGADLHGSDGMGGVPGYGFADDMVTMAISSGTQWDGLSHFFHDYKMYNGHDCHLVGSTGTPVNSAAVLADKLVTRGVLVDLPRAAGVDWLEPTHRVSIEEIENALERQKAEVREGDILLIRTGNMLRARQDDGWVEYAKHPEPGPTVEVLPWLHDKRVAGIATDNWAVEAVPSRGPLMFPVHGVAIVHMGLLMGEIFDLEALAADCAEDGVYEFMLNGGALPFTGAVSAPCNPVAVK